MTMLEFREHRSGEPEEAQYKPVFIFAQEICGVRSLSDSQDTPIAEILLRGGHRVCVFNRAETVADEAYRALTLELYERKEAAEIAKRMETPPA